MFPIMTHADKMHPQSNIRLIQSFWREIWITTQPQQPSSHFKKHIHPPKHYEYAGKGFRISWIAINVVEAKCCSTISLYSHADLLEQSTTTQITQRSKRYCQWVEHSHRRSPIRPVGWYCMRKKKKDAFSYSKTDKRIHFLCLVLKLASWRSKTFLVILRAAQHKFTWLWGWFHDTEVKKTLWGVND